MGEAVPTSGGLSALRRWLAAVDKAADAGHGPGESPFVVDVAAKRIGFGPHADAARGDWSHDDIIDRHDLGGVTVRFTYSPDWVAEAWVSGHSGRETGRAMAEQAAAIWDAAYWVMPVLGRHADLHVYYGHDMAILRLEDGRIVAERSNPPDGRELQPLQWGRFVYRVYVVDELEPRVVLFGPRGGSHHLVGDGSGSLKFEAKKKKKTPRTFIGVRFQVVNDELRVVRVGEPKSEYRRRGWPYRRNPGVDATLQAAMRRLLAAPDPYEAIGLAVRFMRVGQERGAEEALLVGADAAFAAKNLDAGEDVLREAFTLGFPPYKLSTRGDPRAIPQPLIVRYYDARRSDWAPVDTSDEAAWKAVFRSQQIFDDAVGPSLSKMGRSPRPFWSSHIGRLTAGVVRMRSWEFGLYRHHARMWSSDPVLDRLENSWPIWGTTGYQPPFSFSSFDDVRLHILSIARRTPWEDYFRQAEGEWRGGYLVPVAPRAFDEHIIQTMIRIHAERIADELERLGL